MADEAYVKQLLKGVDNWNVWIRSGDAPYADLSGADLSNRDFYNIDFSFSNLRRADLQKANLSHADFTLADLTDADVSRTQLNRAIFGAAKMARADLTESYLVGATLNQTQLDFANLTPKPSRKSAGVIRPCCFRSASTRPRWKRTRRGPQNSARATSATSPAGRSTTNIKRASRVYCDLTVKKA